MKEWYLIKSPSMTGGGLEEEALNSQKDDFLSEILETELASTVTVYNYDLSESKEIRAVIQDNLGDTTLKTMERTILVPIGTLISGNYVYFEDEYWLVVGRPGNNHVYEKAKLALCQFQLKWQKDDGTIVSRWANYASASKYDVGENGNYTLMYASNTLSVLLPNDPDAQTCEWKRVFIDRRDEPRRVFKIQRLDDVLFDYHNHGGVLSLIANRDMFNPDTDNTELGICDYEAPIEPPTSEGDVITELHISYKGSPSVVSGGNAKKFTLFALTSDGQEADLRSCKWTVTTQPEYSKYVHYEVISPTVISIKVDYKKEMIGDAQILLTAKVYDLSVSEYIEVGGGI